MEEYYSQVQSLGQKFQNRAFKRLSMKPTLVTNKTETIKTNLWSMYSKWEKVIVSKTWHAWYVPIMCLGSREREQKHSVLSNQGEGKVGLEL